MRTHKHWPRIVMMLLFFAVVTPSMVSHAEPQRRNRRSSRVRSRVPKIDYGNFAHVTHVDGQKLECSSCHIFPTKNWNTVRKGDEAFADVVEFPEHNACLSCHRQQFFARERPAPAICSNCHVAVTPKETARWIFPSLGEPFFASKRAETFISEFVVAFPHDKHTDDVVSRNRGDRDGPFRFTRASFAPEQKNCSLCHVTYKPQGDSKDEFVTPPPKNLPDEAFWLRKGTFETTPLTHTRCFTCHNSDVGIEPLQNNCGACHKLRPPEGMQHDYQPAIAANMGITDRLMLLRWSRRSTARFRHEHEVHKELGCETCHTVATMNLLNERTLVNVKSCGGEGSGCHVESSTDGILNYEIEQKKKQPDFQCTKCHVVLGKQAIPPDHQSALPK